jgi:hypothetical protein
MAQIDLELRARRAYELGRARLGLKAAGAALLLGVAALLLGRPPGLTGILCCALLPLAAVLAFRGRAAGRAVWPGLAVGSAAMLLPLSVGTIGRLCLGPACMRFCLPACVLGGVLSGAALATLASREGEGGREFLLAGVVVAALTATLGCTLAGAGGVAGMAIGVLAGGAPVWLAAHARR